MTLHGMVVCSLLLFAASVRAQEADSSTVPDHPTKYRQPPAGSIVPLPAFDGAPSRSFPADSVRFNMYGDLRNDDPEYTEKSSIWMCAFRVTMNNIVTWAADRYLLNADYARITPESWKHNLKTGPVWDVDRFGMNYFFHPYSGAGYFNAARANGYTFLESAPFALGGSVMWEYFGENTLPSVNDLINTTVTGSLLGEISFRLSSNFLDDRTAGWERFWRELFAGVIDPSRFFSRFLQGKFFRVTTGETYQREPLNMTFSAGVRYVNEGRSFGTGSASDALTLHLDYGNPFEHRTRKIFDYFKLRADLSFGVGRKIISNVMGNGILFGKNFKSGDTEMLAGLFQHYDFWDNKAFELGTIAFGAGLITRTPISATSNLYCDVHLGVVPLAGNSTRLGPDTSQFIDYNYGGGVEGKLETTLNLGGWSSATLRGYYYWIHTYVGNMGDNFIGILKPSIAFTLFANLSIGFEHLIYFSDRYPRDFPNVHDMRSEQKIFLQYYVDNFKQER